HLHRTDQCHGHTWWGCLYLFVPSHGNGTWIRVNLAPSRHFLGVARPSYPLGERTLQNPSRTYRENHRRTALVSRKRMIDLNRPAFHTAFKVPYFLVSQRSKETGCPCTPHPGVTIGHDLISGIKFTYPLRQLTQRYQSRIFQVNYFVLVRLPYIQKQDLLSRSDL